MIKNEYLKENDYIVQKMMRIPALRPFKEEDIHELLENSQTRTIKAGELILEENSYTTLIYYLISGKIKVVKDNVTLAVMQRVGDIFGEMGPISGSTRTASVYAEEESVCIEIDAANIYDVEGSDVHSFRYIVLRGFAETLANRLKVTTENLIQAKEEIASLKALVKKNKK